MTKKQNCNKVTESYLAVVERIIKSGRDYANKNRQYPDGTPVYRRQVTSHTFRHDMLNDGFPAITCKELFWNGVVSELLWFLRGDTNVFTLKKSKVHFWDKDAYNAYKRIALANEANPAVNAIYVACSNATNVRGCDIEIADSFSMLTFEEFKDILTHAPSLAFLKENYSFKDYTLGDVGRNYSAQWRDWRGDKSLVELTNGDVVEGILSFDQINDLVNAMKADIMSSRLKVAAWNPAELDLTALPPCHSGFQIVGVPLTFQERMQLANKSGYANGFIYSIDINDYANDMHALEHVLAGIPEFGFEMHWEQRSCDVFLGIPLNIASYGLLGKILELATGFPCLAIEGNFKCVHLYDNSYEQSKSMLVNYTAQPQCELLISDDLLALKLSDIDTLLSNMTSESFKLSGYSPDKLVGEKVEMLAPKQ
jgi:thymidylate synthase